LISKLVSLIVETRDDIMTQDCVHPELIEILILLMKDETRAAALGPAQVSLLIKEVSLLLDEVSDDLLCLSEVPHNFGDRMPPPLKL
jgi:hypothetical protein